MNKRVMALLGLLFTLAGCHTTVTQVVLETHDLRLEIGSDGVVQSLTARPIRYGVFRQSRGRPQTVLVSRRQCAVPCLTVRKM
jgi:hypothetical protein